ncbi:enoyl-hydratase isomerase family protein [Pyrenophora tritici-repentis]|nr:enoyl-hydratase isomerase family protein [Pyrenophora tritici-repentis]KAI0611671.1 enoyl-hydratase isomerase family protein [Pyrenophora tritici-repentis]KAI0623667.1 enoyl-hydratase isomerase family protein [Pyrenophora tritici-repentis]PZC98875.1 CaiD, Enoyl-CoA hydratase carnithine racemase [Pyrenophora tritici-repentis]PZD29309.1 CaiD, Enoyl-CoA hydratasecarnithine racemase [Pyrenophora tritici-repentis]
MMAEAYQKEFFNVTFPAEYVAHVEINRPEKMNAFKEVMWQNLNQIFNTLSTDPSVRSIILSGAGPRAFTAGLDVNAASTSGPLASSKTPDPARTANAIRRHVLDFQACISSIEKCEKPVICIIHGIAYGLALDMSLACDIRISTQDTKFSVKEVDIGIAADIGTLSRLPHAVGNASWVKDVALSARIFGSEEALRVGLVSNVYKDKTEAVAEGIKLASLIASKSPVAVLGTKELLNYSRDRPVEEGLRYTAVWNMAMLQTEDVPRAMGSGIKKTVPKFSKL